MTGEFIKIIQHITYKYEYVMVTHTSSTRKLTDILFHQSVIELKTFQHCYRIDKTTAFLILANYTSNHEVSVN